MGLAALVFLRERQPLLFWLGMAVSAAGVGLRLSKEPLWNSAPGRGDILALTASGFYAAYILTTRRARMQLAAPTVFVLSL